MNIKLGISSLGLGFIAANSFAGSLSTIYGTNNNGSFGGAVYFDTIIGANDLTVTGFDMNLFNTASTFTLNVYTRSGTYAGATGSTTGWTLVGTGTGTGSAKDLPSHVDLNSTFLLGAGTTTGMALELVDNSNAYTNGTGANQSYSNSDLSLSLGAASNAILATSLDRRDLLQSLIGTRASIFCSAWTRRNRVDPTTTKELNS
jgi:hypothetical protein